MSFDALVILAIVSSFLSATVWLQKRTTDQLQFQKQQTQFWAKVLSKNSSNE